MSASDKKKLYISGFATCGAFKQAKTALLGLQAIFPSDYAVEIQEHETRDEYMAQLVGLRNILHQPDHKTSPIVWYDDNQYLGGRDATVAWCRQLLAGPASSSSSSSSAATAAAVAVARAAVDTWDPSHNYTYDLVVIGGGSGGLACSKEAKKRGATRVAVLDFVKPSPHGSKWGLGGTCVNVGCIPKKLMHHAALLGEHAMVSKRFGWNLGENKEHNWNTLKANVQDHIKGLNFGYRVEMRETGVTYLNKLGHFVGPHELEVVDAKGNTSIISAARFVIAVGGRPTPLNIPGGELAISSDDIFSLATPPGRTLVVGGGYVALECAGFLQGLQPSEKVTVLIRSKPLRTFDQDTVGYVTNYMRHMGTELIENTLPLSIERLANGRLRVRWITKSPQGMPAEGEGEFDTVLTATGRTPDLRGLTLENIGGAGVQMHPESGKVVTRYEQTTIPHIYAIGDVVHGGLELTPVAILAGKLLARRLFANASEVIDYRNIPSAVFTPLELGTVGLTEAEAIDLHGADNVDCYLSQFAPLEWTLDEAPQQSYIKLVVKKLPAGEEQVVGIHMACPGASEIIQGYALAMKKGLTVRELGETVGIHPTIGEELTLMKTAKSSGASIAKRGC